AKLGNTLEAPGSVSGEVELEQLFTHLLVFCSFSKLIVRHALACIPSPVGRPNGMLAALSCLNRLSLPSPLRLPRDVVPPLNEAIIIDSRRFCCSCAKATRLTAACLPSSLSCKDAKKRSLLLTTMCAAPHSDILYSGGRSWGKRKGLSNAQVQRSPGRRQKMGFALSGWPRSEC
ncbi:unnamed protein product, partial [Ectocarpus sp. 12 AP-2014]